MNNLLKIFVCVVIVATSQLSMAGITDCMEPLQKVHQGIALQPPADPVVLQEILALRHDGEKLCRDGNAQDGIKKLEQALGLFPANGLLPASALPQ
ncbi:MAG: hypothetical protein ACXW1W_09465 [Methylococcaceae bacterium]